MIKSGSDTDAIAGATIFANPAAGRGNFQRKIAAVRDEFARWNYCASIVETGSAEELRSAVRSAIEAGCKTIIAMGGDGTVQLVAQEAIGFQVQIGMIPTGGGNDFAAALGISTNIEKAVEVIAHGKTRLVDVVRVPNATGVDAIYLGGGGAGLDVEALRYASGKFAKWPGRVRYLASAIAGLRGFRGVQVKVEFPGTDLPNIAGTALLVAILNSPSFGGGMRLAPEARVDDGMLDFVMIEMLKKREVLALIPRLLIKGELKTKRMVRARAANIKLSTAADSWFQGDGELLGRTPVEINILPRALRVLVPQAKYPRNLVELSEL